MRLAFALVVGSVGAADVGAFAPAEAEPLQVLEHGGDVFRLAAVAVQIVILSLSATDAMSDAVAGGTSADVSSLLNGVTSGLKTKPPFPPGMPPARPQGAECRRDPSTRTRHGASAR